MIELAEVTKRYGGAARGGNDALRALSLRIARGEAVGIVGPNGAGKSTLLGLVLGFLRPTAGRLTIDTKAPRDWVRRNGAAWLPERFALPPEWRVRAALAAFARLEGLSGDDAARAAGAALARFGLEAHGERRAGTLSRGLLQRTGLAQATLVPRTLVVLDEPTEGLDPHGRFLLRESVAAMRATGATVLIASHDLGELERIVDRALLLESGRVRESLALAGRPPGTLLNYELGLAAEASAVHELFPGARRLDGPAPAGAPVRYHVEVRDAADLSARLAALLAAGGVVQALLPVSPSLEQRVRQALETPAPPPAAAEEELS